MMSTTKNLFLFSSIIINILYVNEATRHAIKVVDEPSSFGMNGGGYQYQQPEVKTLKLRIPPSNFSGPPHLKRLMGKCFKLTDSSYKYEVCPFSNITQHEQSLRWNPYSGILGVWQEWKIVNNTFLAMVFTEGDSCGSQSRAATVYFQCGNSTNVTKVEEPSKCHYAIHLQTPLVCHPHAMLVYPTLNATLREEWDILEGQYENEEFTKQGYLVKLRQIFEKAGYCIPEEVKTKILEDIKEKMAQQEKEAHGQFESLDKCAEDYKKLKEQVESLKTLLEANGINPSNGERDYAQRAAVEQQHQQEHMNHYEDHHLDDFV